MKNSWFLRIFTLILGGICIAVTFIFALDAPYFIEEAKESLIPITIYSLIMLMLVTMINYYIRSLFYLFNIFPLVDAKKRKGFKFSSECYMFTFGLSAFCMLMPCFLAFQVGWSLQIFNFLIMSIIFGIYLLNFIFIYFKIIRGK